MNRSKIEAPHCLYKQDQERGSGECVWEILHPAVDISTQSHRVNPLQKSNGPPNNLCKWGRSWCSVWSTYSLKEFLETEQALIQCQQLFFCKSLYSQSFPRTESGIFPTCNPVKERHFQAIPAKYSAVLHGAPKFRPRITIPDSNNQKDHQQHKNQNILLGY